MIDIVGAFLSAVSVYQGWSAPRIDAKKKTEDFVVILDQLKILDDVFFGSKKIHDCVEVFFKSTSNSLRILEEAAEGNSSPKELKEKFVEISHHFDHYSGRLPNHLQKVHTDFSTLHADPNITPDIKHDVECMVLFYNKMIASNEAIDPIFNHLKSDPPHKDSSNSKDIISSLNIAMEYLLINADKVIYHGASIVSYLHVEMRNNI